MREIVTSPMNPGNDLTATVLWGHQAKHEDKNVLPVVVVLDANNDVHASLMKSLCVPWAADTHWGGQRKLSQ